MKDVCVLFGGDQLIRVCFVGVKDFCKGCYIVKDRFDYCSFFVVEFFYIEMFFLQVLFDNKIEIIE